MRGDFLGGGNLAGVFFNQVFNGLDPNSFALGRVEESVFVTFYRNNVLAYFQVVFQSFFYFGTEIYNHFISAFSSNLDSIIFEIYVFYVKTYTFRNTNTCSEQESNESEVTVFGFFIIYLFLTGKVVPAVLNIIQQQGNFISFQANDAFLMNLWNVYKDGRICVNHFTFKIICIKTSQ